MWLEIVKLKCDDQKAIYDNNYINIKQNTILYSIAIFCIYLHISI